ncbi:general stress protein [Sanguibacter sp. 26GB23]
MSRSTTPPKLPTLPRGDQIAAFFTYLDAQKGVELLSDKGFPVQHVTIVGTDLKMVERVTGRLTYSRVAAAGLASGAWFGLFVGLVLSLFGGETTALPIFAAIGIGAGFGLLFSVLSFTMTRGKRDFTSASQIVASSYALLCDHERAGEASRILEDHHASGLGAGQAWPPAAAVPSAGAGAQSSAVPASPPAAPEPSRPLPEPRYGVRTPDGLPPKPAGTQSNDSSAQDAR